MPRGFKKGDITPMSKYSQWRVEKKTRPSKLKKSVYSAPVKREALRAIENGVPVEAAAKVLGCSPRSLYNWKKSPCETRKRGPPRAIDTVPNAKQVLMDIALQDPFARVQHLGEKLRDATGLQLGNSTLREELYHRGPQHLSLKIPDTSCDEKNLENLIDMQVGYKEGLCRALDTREIHEQQICCLDEFPIYVGQLKTKGRSPKGKKLFGRQRYRAVRYTAVAVISRQRCVKIDLLKENMTDTAFMRFCLEEQPMLDNSSHVGGKPLSQLIPPGSFLLWDRLGRSGRCKNPCKIHYNPRVISSLKDAGILPVFLPPKGHMFNPIELFNNVIQERVARWHPPGEPRDDYDHLIVGPRNFTEAQMAVSSAVSEVTERMFEGFYAARLQGRSFEERHARSTAFGAVMEERSEVAVIYRWPSHTDADDYET